MVSNFLKVSKPAEKPEPGPSRIGIRNSSPSLTPTVSVVLFALVAWAAQDLLERRSWQAAKWISGVGVVVICIVLTRQNLQSWKNSEAAERC
jgi:hypothetical protein